MRSARIAEVGRDVMPMTTSPPGRQSVPESACLPPGQARGTLPRFRSNSIPPQTPEPSNQSGTTERHGKRLSKAGNPVAKSFARSPPATEKAARFPPARPRCARRLKPCETCARQALQIFAEDFIVSLSNYNTDNHQFAKICGLIRVNLKERYLIKLNLPCHFLIIYFTNLITCFRSLDRK